MRFIPRQLEVDFLLALGDRRLAVVEAKPTRTPVRPPAHLTIPARYLTIV